MATGAAATSSLRPLNSSTLILRQSLREILGNCIVFISPSTVNAWLIAMTGLVLTGLLANVVLLWLLLRGGRALSASKVVGLNLAVLDIVYLLLLPIPVYVDVYTANHINVTMDHTEEASLSALTRTEKAFSALNSVGCPLLLTCMCVERYLAAAWPVVYLKLRRWEYRAVCLGLVWVITFTMALVGVFVDKEDMWVPLAAIMSVLFLVMLGCLGGVVWVLWKPSPAQTRGGSPPLRRRALVNLLAVLVPTAIAYLPIIVLLPIVSLVHSGSQPLNMKLCLTIYVMTSFPNFGVYIGPLFYLAKARQLMCSWK